MHDVHAETYADTIDGPGSHESLLPLPGEMPLPGTVLGAYKIIDLLGEGGMGCVYRAEHVRLGRRVALKMLRPQCAANPVNLKRFFSEARAVNQISHEHIIEITDFFDGTNAQKYYIMELLEGMSLYELTQAEGVPALGRTLRIASQICEGLRVVHDAGIVHRDLKPANIFLTTRAGRRDFVKLLDFGIAKLTDVPTGESLHQTAAGVLLGTPDYMSPEQAGGRGDIDHRTDVYALGVILYELVTGRRPFRAKSCAQLLVKHMTETPAPPNEVPDRPFELPAALSQLILQCLAKRPEDRPQSMAMIACRLQAIVTEIAENPPEPRPPSDPVALPRSTSYEPASQDIGWPAAAPLASIAAPVEVSGASFNGVAAAFALVLLGTGLGAWQWSQSRGHAVVLDEAAPPIALKAPARVEITTANTIVAPKVTQPAVVHPNPAAPKAKTKKGWRRRRARRATARLRPAKPAPVVAAPVEAAPVEAPPKEAAPKEAAPVERVRVVITSKPSGAQVYLHGRRIGVTPFSETFARQDVSRAFELRLGGYEDVTKPLKLTADRQLDVTLEAASPPAAPSADVILDPFSGG